MGAAWWELLPLAGRVAVEVLAAAVLRHRSPTRGLEEDFANYDIETKAILYRRRIPAPS